MPLTKDFPLFQSCLLEASAGTGKTFTITHLFVRFLLNKVPLEKILVVTFTKAAVAELKTRVRAQIKSTIDLIEAGKELPEYFEGHDLEESLLILQRALLSFEEASIMTIHAFCARMLAAGGLLGVIEESSELLFEDRLQFLCEDVVHLGLLGVGIKEEDLTSLEANMEKMIPLALRYLKDSKEVFHNFKSLDKLYQEKGPLLVQLLAGAPIREQFVKIAPFYNGIKHPEKALACLEEIQGEGLSFVRFVKLLYMCAPLLAIHSDNLNKRKKTAPPPSFFSALQQLLASIKSHNNERSLMALLLATVQSVKKGARQHFPSQDDALSQMLSALKIPSFLAYVQESFSVAIIDEFQDTDPLQWQIFSACFYPDKPCFLVGDPKQSIYSFRKADVYTYLQAAQATGRKVILNTNWRSTPELVTAFNALFCHKEWLYLPKKSLFLKAPHLHAGQSSLALQDGKGAIHFLLLKDVKTKAAQEKHFFIAIAEEIATLKEALIDIAILVSDKGQARRLELFLKKQGFPVANWQRLNKDDDEQDLAFRVFLEALLKPHESGLVKAALMTPLFRWTHEEVQQEAFQRAKEEFLQLHLLWHDKSFAAVLVALLASRSLRPEGEQTLAEDLDSFSEGKKLLRDIKRQAEALLEEDWMRYPHLPEEVLAHFDRHIIPPRKGAQGINILTTHASKGLEFTIVFALSLTFGSYKREELFTAEDKIMFIDADPKAYELYLQEKDAEKLRQLYVAMTRAKKRLYLPFLMQEKEAKPGLASPLELFWQSQKEEGQDFLAYLAFLQERAAISYSFVTERKNGCLHHVEKEASLLEKPCPLPYKAMPKRVLSFSVLAKKGERHVESQGACEDQMPSGAFVGDILHKILEHIPPTLWQDKEGIKAFVHAYTLNTPLALWNEKIAQLLYTTFQMPLHGFSLKDVEPRKVMREIEFLHKGSSHYLKGFVDMAFEYQGGYYLVDWKSNLLPNYRQESLAMAMQSADYFLQAEIYRDAFCAYLKQFGKEAQFKGLFYIFLRGPAFYYVP